MNTRLSDQNCIVCKTVKLFIFLLNRFWPVDYLHRVKLSLNKKAEKSRSFLRIDRNGVVNRKAQFISDIEKEMEVPVCDVDSDDATTSEEEEEEVD